MGRFTFRAAVIALTVFVSSVSFAAPPPPYQFTDLGTLGAPNGVFGTWPHAVNNAGQVAGRGSSPTRHYTPFRWTNGVMTPLAPNLYGDASGMNNAGQVVGAVQPTDGGSPLSAFVWTNGTLTTLPSAGWFEASAKAISNGGPNGVIVTGFVRPFLGNISAALWQNGALTTIPNMDIGLGVNDQGHVVGDFRDSFNTTNAVRYDNGATSTMWNNGSARDINNAGQIVGWRSVNGQTSSVIYDNGVFTDIVFGGDVNFAMSINESGDVVGRFQPSPNVDHGYLWQDGQFYDLNTIASAGPGNVFATAEGINDQGQIVGLYRNSSGILGGYLLTPVPEPAGVVAGIVIGVALLTRRGGGREGRHSVASD